MLESGNLFSGSSLRCTLLFIINWQQCSTWVTQVVCKVDKNEILKKLESTKRIIQIKKQLFRQTKQLFWFRSTKQLFRSTKQLFVGGTVLKNIDQINNLSYYSCTSPAKFVSLWSVKNISSFVTLSTFVLFSWMFLARMHLRCLKRRWMKKVFYVIIINFIKFSILTLYGR